MVSRQLVHTPTGGPLNVPGKASNLLTEEKGGGGGLRMEKIRIVGWFGIGRCRIELAIGCMRIRGYNLRGRIWGEGN